MPAQSLRAKLLERRTYIRPLDDEGTLFETKAAAVERQITHQRYLWENAKKEKFDYLRIAAKEAWAQWSELRHTAPYAAAQLISFARGFEDEYAASWPLNEAEEAELAELRELIVSRKASLSGRVKWMADTDVIRERPSAGFNCSFLEVQLPADYVDALWLLLQGCGVGFRPITGMLSGFANDMDVKVIGSTRTEKGGREKTIEKFDGTTWTISFGDSAKGWAKGLGKLLAHKYRAEKLVLDLSQIRPAGLRLRGYGWISSGWEPFAAGLKIITDVMNTRAGDKLTAIDMGDIMNACGSVLSSRRAAEIWLLDDDHPEVMSFFTTKNGIYEPGGAYWREQSNNSISFKNKPSRSMLTDILVNVLKGGEPGLYNLAGALRRATWAKGTNPCAEIILPNKGFCNLVQIVWSRFNGDFAGAMRAHYILSRANYRQTLVDMRDGVLQLAWHDNNKLLRLCGVSPTGVMGCDFARDPMALEELAGASISAANRMADELGQNRPALVTQVQPAGTSSKVLGEDGDEVQEGVHISPSRYVFNNVMFSEHDPLVTKARDAGYEVKQHPTQPTAVLVTLPVAFPANDLYKPFVMPNGEVIEIVQETAVDQLDRYLLFMQHYVDHNCSITVSYDETEIPAIVDWLDVNWDDYVGVSFLKRNSDPTKTAADLGFAYLPQEAVSADRYKAYVRGLRDISLEEDTTEGGVDDLTACATGACPIR